MKIAELGDFQNCSWRDKGHKPDFNGEVAKMRIIQYLSCRESQKCVHSLGFYVCLHIQCK